MRPIWSKLGWLSLAMTTSACASAPPLPPWACDTFGEIGSVQLAQVTSDIATTTDNKLMVSGRLPHSVDPTEPFSLMRLSSDGSPDSAFADGGHFMFAQPSKDLGGGAVEVDGEGRVVFSSYPNEPATEGVVGRLLQDGSLDDSFGLEGVVGVHGHITLTRDRVVVTNHQSITLLDHDGAPDPAFGLGGSVDLNATGTGWDARVQEDGRIVLLGRELDPTQGALLVRLDASGALDPSFGAGGFVELDYGTRIELDAQDRILVSGCHSQCSVHVVGRFTADGLIDTSFGQGGALARRRADGYLGEIEVLSDGRILLLGDPMTRLLPDGGLDLTFGEQGELRGFTEDGAAPHGGVGPDGQIYLAIVILSGSGDFLESTRLFCIKPDGHD